ncbi:hypothetical protein WJX72_010655 [[Myrmecia] bisecta]|uniref:ADP-ribosylglycohydrolase n=1 Tax=[Myrmecia] bisecta TaxID=41462 RepID=A0AAW1Q4B6_9CHLO
MLLDKCLIEVNGQGRAATFKEREARAVGNAEEAITKAINLGGDADTVGAITGQMACAFDGAPGRWLDGLKHMDKIHRRAVALYKRQPFQDTFMLAP